MTNFDKYKELYQCDFSKAITDVSATTYSQAQLRQREQEHQLQKLFEFIELWKDHYELFCDNFNAYSYTKQSMPVWSEGYTENGYLKLTYPKSEFYIDEFFNMVLNKRAKFEIQEYRKNYDSVYDTSGRIYQYAIQPDRNIIISGNKFTVIGKDNNYRLDIKMHAALICSLIVALSNNYIIYDWYSKQSRFKEFIDRMASSHYFVEFQVNSQYNRVLISGSQNEPSLRIDIDGEWLYFILPNEILRIENRLHYNHLDKLFGENREKPLTREDLQLYSIVNEGRKPIMYDFEFLPK